jgi:5-methyltetrahydrofolate--homocysteine methyltransferase
LHDLGKNIVVAMLRANSFEVVDLGVDVPVARFVDAVRESKPDILGIGAYMSTTIPQIADVINAIEAAGLREGIKITVGGVCINDVIAEACGADAYGGDAMSTVRLANKFMGVA